MLPLLFLAQAVSDMTLVCNGSTAVNAATEQTLATASDNRGNVAIGTATSSAPALIPITVRFRVAAGAASMNVPSFASPGLGRRDSAWYEVKGLVMTDEYITGRVKFNFLNNSKFRIDRLSGEITTENGYVGYCKPEEPRKQKF